MSWGVAPSRSARCGSKSTPLRPHSGFAANPAAASAVGIGLVPSLPLARIVSAGNVAGEGAKIAALSVTERAAAHAILDEVEYVELSGRADFNDLFIDQLSFPT